MKLFVEVSSQARDIEITIHNGKNILEQKGSAVVRWVEYAAKRHFESYRQYKPVIKVMDTKTILITFGSHSIHPEYPRNPDLPPVKMPGAYELSAFFAQVCLIEDVLAWENER